MEFIQVQVLSTGVFLDLYPDTELNFEIENNMLANDLSISTFAYQFKIPATGNNLKTLGFVNVVAADIDLQAQIPVQIYLGRLPWKKGKLINVDNSNYTEKNYLEYGFVGDKANLDLNKKLSEVLANVTADIPFTEVNVCSARFDLLYPTKNKFQEEITAIYGGEPPNWEVAADLYECGITLEDNDGTPYSASAIYRADLTTTTYNLTFLRDIVNQLNSNTGFSAQAIAKVDFYNPKDENVDGFTPTSDPYLKTSNPDVNAAENIWGIITIIPKSNATKKLRITWAYRRFQSGFSSTLGITIIGNFNINVPWYNFPKRNFNINDWYSSIESSNFALFPQMIASRIYDDLGTTEDDSFDVYGGQNNYFSKKGEKYDYAKSYPQSSASKPVYVEFGDPIKYYQSQTDINPNEDPITAPSKWIELSPEQFINEWANGGFILHLDNEVYDNKWFRRTIIPCFYLKRTIEKIFEFFPIPISGEVLADGDIGKMILVWNKTLDSMGSTEFPRDTPERRTLLQNVINYYWNNYQSQIVMGNYFPDLTVKEFLEQLRNALGLGFLFKDNTCEIVFMETVLNSAPVDFTNKAIRGITLKKDEYKGVTFLTERDDDVNVALQGLPFTKYQYEEDSEGLVVSTPIGTLVQGQTVGGYVQAPGAYAPYRIPLFGSKFTSDYYKADNSANLKLLWYNGIRQEGVRYATSGRTGPTGSSNLNAFTLDKTALFFKYWPTWAKWQKETKYVKMLLKLELTDLLNFTFKQKIQIQFTNYVVKKINCKATMQGLAPTQFEMYSINN